MDGIGDMGITAPRIGVWFGAPLPFYYYPYTYSYPAPYPYYAPSTVIVERSVPAPQPLPAQPQYWYYCESAGSYYPYTPSCPEGWKAVPATPSMPTK